MEAIILAGGLGTRLRGVVRDVPKPMADVGGRPFLEYLLAELARRGATRFILSVGHLAEVVRDHFGDRHLGLPVDYSVETEPLGTGGAIFRALELARDERVLVQNGDTLLLADPWELLEAHRRAGDDITLTLRRMDDASRYGLVEVRGDRVTGFAEKRPGASGWINAGVYALARRLLARRPAGARFSFEADFLPGAVDTFKVGARFADGYFIDIGVPEDYRRAGRELPGLVELPGRERGAER